MKTAFINRNGIPSSYRGVMTEFFSVHGDHDGAPVDRGRSGLPRRADGAQQQLPPRARPARRAGDSVRDRRRTGRPAASAGCRTGRSARGTPSSPIASGCRARRRGAARKRIYPEYTATIEALKKTMTPNRTGVDQALSGTAHVPRGRGVNRFRAPLRRPVLRALRPGHAAGRGRAAATRRGPSAPGPRVAAPRRHDVAGHHCLRPESAARLHRQQRRHGLPLGAARMDARRRGSDWRVAWGSAESAARQRGRALRRGCVSRSGSCWRPRCSITGWRR